MDATLVEGLDGLLGNMVSVLTVLKTVCHTTEPDYLTLLQLLIDNSLNFLDVSHRWLRWIPQLSECQKRPGVAITTVVGTSAAVGVESGWIVTPVAFVAFHFLEKTIKLLHLVSVY